MVVSGIFFLFCGLSVRGLHVDGARTSMRTVGSIWCHAGGSEGLRVNIGCVLMSFTVSCLLGRIAIIIIR